MGVAIIGGLISSTVLTLLVVPAAYSFIDRFRVWANRKGKQLFGVVEDPNAFEAASAPANGHHPASPSDVRPS
jgi:hypothetical protein